MTNEIMWRGEFPAAYAVPATIDRLVRANVLYDLSWHNDAAPSFCLNDGPEPDEHTPRIWIDHPDPIERENGPESPRYLVTDEEEAEKLAAARVGRGEAAYNDGVIFESEDDLRGALLALGVSAEDIDRGEVQ